MKRNPDIKKNEKIKESYKATMVKRESQDCRVFKVKVQKNKLNATQKEALKMMFVEAKWMYNHILNLSETDSVFDIEYTDLTTVSHFDKDRNPIESQLKYISSQMKQGVVEGIKSSIRSLAKLKEKGYEVGALKFISEYTSIDLKQANVSYKIVSKNKIKIQGIKKPIKANGLKQILSLPEYELANAKLINDVDGYFIAITVYINKKSDKPTEKIGIDFGCQTSLTLSTGEKINFVVEESEQIKNIKRKMDRCKMGSKNKRKLSFKLRRLNKLDLNRKDDMANKIAHNLLDSYIIVMQDEQLHEWAKEHGEKIQYGILGRVKSRLMRNPNTIVLSRWIPTTKFCSNCGNSIDLSLYDRTFECSCGECTDRDVHAAKNMLWLDKNIIGVGRTDYKSDEFKKNLKLFFDYQEAAKSLV